MIRRLKVIVLALVCSGQMAVSQEVRFDTPAQLAFFRFLEIEAAEQQRMREVRAAEIDQVYREKQFLDRMNRVASIWTRMSDEYNRKHAFNMKLAREVSEAFRALETGEGWPKPSSKT